MWILCLFLTVTCNSSCENFSNGYFNIGLIKIKHNSAIQFVRFLDGGRRISRILKFLERKSFPFVTALNARGFELKATFFNWETEEFELVSFVKKTNKGIEQFVYRNCWIKLINVMMNFLLLCRDVLWKSFFENYIHWKFKYLFEDIIFYEVRIFRCFRFIKLLALLSFHFIYCIEYC